MDKSVGNDNCCTQRASVFEGELGAQMSMIMKYDSRPSIFCGRFNLAYPTAGYYNYTMASMLVPVPSPLAYQVTLRST